MTDLDIEETATELAHRIYEWAKQAGALANGPGSTAITADMLCFLAVPHEISEGSATNRLKRLKIVAVAADDHERHVAILLKNQVPEAARKNLPQRIGGCSVEFVGQSEVPNFPPTVAPQSSTLGGSRFWTHGNSVTCGSSISAAPIASAGTFGALLRLPNGQLCGLTNNHITGGCNHTEVGMYVMCPASIDAMVDRPPPTAIGTHLQLTQIQSGDPGQTIKQRLDAAIFKILGEGLVSSWQGDRFFDTPTDVLPPSAHMRLKKVGRTSGLTFGRVNGEVKTSLVVPYKAPKLQADVHFEGLWSVIGTKGDEFSTFGDSGSLVVTEDGMHAVGLILGGEHGVTYMMPIIDVLSHFSATLVGGHNI